MATNSGSAATRRQEIDSRQESLTQLNSLLPQAVEALQRNLSCGVPDVEVQAAQTIMNTVLMPEASYSFTGHISNQTNYTLTLSKKDCNGSWTTDPPATIGAGGSADFAADYEGFHFHGEVVYTASGATGEFKMTWSIPLFGNNSISDSTTISGTSASYEGGRGWHAEVWYFLKAA
jgi:hypothetical protein